MKELCVETVFDLCRICTKFVENLVEDSINRHRKEGALKEQQAEADQEVMIFGEKMVVFSEELIVSHMARNGEWNFMGRFLEYLLPVAYADSSD